MTHRARYKETDTSSAAPTETRGRDFMPRKGDFRELLGLALAAGAFVLFVARPELPEALVHTFVTGAAGFTP